MLLITSMSVRGDAVCGTGEWFTLLKESSKFEFEVWDMNGHNKLAIGAKSTDFSNPSAVFLLYDGVNSAVPQISKNISSVTIDSTTHQINGFRAVSILTEDSLNNRANGVLYSFYP